MPTLEPSLYEPSNPQYPGGIISGIACAAAFISIILAIHIRVGEKVIVNGGKESVKYSATNRLVAYSLLGLWALVPPIWFLAELYIWRPPSKDVFESMVHSQDLARNIWIAFVLVLGKITGIKWQAE